MRQGPIYSTLQKKAPTLWGRGSSSLGSGVKPSVKNNCVRLLDLLHLDRSRRTSSDKMSPVLQSKTQRLVQCKTRITHWETSVLAFRDHAQKGAPHFSPELARTKHQFPFSISQLYLEPEDQSLKCGRSRQSGQTYGRPWSPKQTRKGCRWHQGL